MRINKYVALATGLSRRAADRAIEAGRVSVNGERAAMGTAANDTDTVSLDGSLLMLPETKTLLLNKPAGYVCSRSGQGSKTVYELLPKAYRHLKTVGRLDKDSSGLLLLSNDGDLINELLHPRYQKAKKYEIELDGPLEPLHQQMISDTGIQLEDGTSRLSLHGLDDARKRWLVEMNEGRNRQIRRTFAALGYRVVRLHRTHFGNYALPSQLKSGKFSEVKVL